MLDEGVSRVTYNDIVGTGLHISALESVADETYEHFELLTTTTRLEVRIKGQMVTYDF